MTEFSSHPPKLGWKIRFQVDLWKPFLFERKHKSANTPTAWNIWPAGGGVQKSKQESELSWSA